MICTKCKIDKPSMMFSIDRHRNLGRYSVCKECCRKKYKEEGGREYWSKWRTEHTEKMREYDRTYRGPDRGCALRLSSIHRYNRIHGDIRHARRLAQVHRDELQKDFCDICGSTEKLVMHHSDYSKPLVVQTVCRTCHSEIHRGIPIPRLCGDRPFKMVA
jgi:hypothetical protein